MNFFCCKRTYKARVYSLNSGGWRGAYYFILIIFNTYLFIYLFFICLFFFPVGEGLFEIDVLRLKTGVATFVFLLLFVNSLIKTVDIEIAWWGVTVQFPHTR